MSHVSSIASNLQRTRDTQRLVQFVGGGFNNSGDKPTKADSIAKRDQSEADLSDFSKQLEMSDLGTPQSAKVRAHEISKEQDIAFTQQVITIRPKRVSTQSIAKSEIMSK